MSDKKRILLTGWFSLRGTKTNTWGDSVQLALDNKFHIDALKTNALNLITEVENSLIRGLKNND